MKVEDAVEILATGLPSRYAFEREFAVAVLSGWINSPADPHASTVVLFAALSQAVLRARDTNLALPEEWLTEIFEADVYLSLLKTALSIPLFWQIEEHISYNNCHYAADLVRFMLTFRSKDPDKRKRASLGKAWEYINKHGGFVGGHFGHGRKAWCSTSGHQLIWRDYKQSSPFQCARFYGSKFDWYLDPRRPEFLDHLTATAAQVRELTTFFREALEVQERLRHVIDERSMSATDFLAFPPSLTPATCRLPAMTATAYGKLAGYRRSTAAANWE